MSLSEGTTRILQTDDPSQLKPAYLVRFPEDVWAQLEKAALTGGQINLSLDDGMHLSIPGSTPLSLSTQSTGSSSEIYTSTSDTLTPYAMASSRLILPVTSLSTSKAADRLRAQNAAHDQERKDRAERVVGTQRAIPPSLHLNEGANMARTVSSPAGPVPNSASTSSGAAVVPMVPLKTRVVQLLALGASSVEDIVSRVGMSESEVMRVVRVVGREVPEGWTLQPNKYSQVKIAQWKYTYAEKMRVLRLAKEAFDELELPEDADERADLDRKEAEVMSGGSSSSERIETPPPIPTPTPIPPLVPASTSSPVPTPTPPKKDKAKKAGGLSLIGKQKAKFAAEKRAASMPNVKKVDGTASPRLEPTIPSDHKPSSTSSKKDDAASTSSRKLSPNGMTGTAKKRISPAPTTSSEDFNKAEKKPVKRKREDEVAPPASVAKKAVSPSKRATSPKKVGYVSATTSSSEEVRGRPTATKPVPSFEKEKDKEQKKKPRKSRDYSSSEDEEPRKRSQPSTRKPPPPELKLNGHKEKERQPDPEALRERYEELFPAYEQLSRKLAQLHRDAEGEEEGEVVEMDQRELGRLVAKWEKWHRELEGIRKWFTT